jgi:hypothetical protein
MAVPDQLMTAPDEKPRWQPRNERERARLQKWTIEQLEQQAREHDARFADYDDALDWYAPLPPEAQLKAQLQTAIVSGNAGNLAPLRKLFPAIAKFINAPKRVRGQRKTSSRKFDPYRRNALESALQDVESIRSIWRKTFKKWKRPIDECSAEAIAALRWGFDVEDVRDRMRRQSSRKHRS